MKKIVLAAILILLFTPQLVSAADLGTGPAGTSEIANMFIRITCTSVPIAFIALLVAIVISGLKFLLSGGEAKAVSAAFQGAIWGVLGILALALAWIVIQIIAAFTGVQQLKLFNISILGAPDASRLSCTTAPPQPSSAQTKPPTAPTAGTVATGGLDVQDAILSDLNSQCFAGRSTSYQNHPEWVRTITTTLPNGQSVRLITAVRNYNSGSYYTQNPGIIFADTGSQPVQDINQVQEAIWKLAEIQYARNVTIQMQGAHYPWPTDLKGMYDLFIKLNFHGKPFPFKQSETDPSIEFVDHDPMKGINLHWNDPEITAPAPRADYLPEYLATLSTGGEPTGDPGNPVRPNYREGYTKYFETPSRGAQIYNIAALRQVVRNVADILLKDTVHDPNKYRDIFAGDTNNADFEWIFLKPTSNQSSIIGSIKWMVAVVSGNPQQQQDLVSCYVTGTSPTIFIYNSAITPLSITPPSSLTYSDPAVINNEWIVRSEPSGNLSLNNNTFPYLYYEYDNHKINFNKPEQGFFSEYANWKQTVGQISKQVGLNTQETTRLLIETQNELQTHAISKYLNISVIPQSELDQKLPLIITPKPTSLYRLHLLIQPVDQIKDLVAPTIKPINRTAFTVVEIGVRY